MKNIELWVDSNDISYILNAYDIREHKDTIENLLHDIRTLKSRVVWHTLPGETPDKDKRMEMSQDNFYRVLAMNDELIHQQKDEIAKLKQTINKLRLKNRKD